MKNTHIIRYVGHVVSEWASLDNPKLISFTEWAEKLNPLQSREPKYQK